MQYTMCVLSTTTWPTYAHPQREIVHAVAPDYENVLRWRRELCKERFFRYSLFSLIHSS